MTMLATNGFQLLGFPLIQAKLTVESVEHLYGVLEDNGRAFSANLSKRADNKLLNNSKRGKVTRFKGATYAFAMAREAAKVPSTGGILIYTTAP